MINPAFAASVVGTIVFFGTMALFLLLRVPRDLGRLDARVTALEKDTHPPVDLTPAMVETLKPLGVMCARPPEGWYCTRPVGHHGPCAAREV